jgi:hypothetical protein
MRITPLLGAALAAAAALCAPAALPQSNGGGELRPPSAFESIADRAARSRAVRRGLQGVHLAALHELPSGPRRPAFARSAGRARPMGDGVPGATCQGCHLSRTVDLFPGAVASYNSILGHPRWELAPLEMAWQGKSIGEICRQLKDETRNGGRDLAIVHEHVGKDDLVAYGWQPGKGRIPAPGTQQLAGELVQMWIDTGAECP